MNSAEVLQHLLEAGVTDIYRISEHSAYSSDVNVFPNDMSLSMFAGYAKYTVTVIENTAYVYEWMMDGKRRPQRPEELPLCEWVQIHPKNRG